MAASYTPCLSKTVAAVAVLTAQRFIGFDGDYPAAGEAAYGVGLNDAEIGDQVNVTVLGTAAVEAGEAIAAGAEVEVGANGKAMTRVNGASAGRALTASGADGDRIELLLLHAGDSTDLAAAEAAIVALEAAIVALEAHAAGDGTDHSAVAAALADVATALAHVAGDGTDHAAVAAAVADVATALAHAAGDGSDHAIVAQLLASLTAIASTSNELGVKRMAYATFDATGGRAIGSHQFGPALPDNATLIRTWYEVIDTFTSATDAATVALGIDVDDVGGIVAATDIADVANPWDAGLHEGIQDGAVANAAGKTTAAARLFVADVAVENLTAGKLRLFAEYFVSE